jgi:hypothetical protein
MIPDNFQKMEFLLGKSTSGMELTIPEQNELRNFIVHQQPSAQNSSFEELVKIGLVLVGIYLLSKSIEE